MQGSALAALATVVALALPAAAAPVSRLAPGAAAAYPSRVTMITDSVGGALFWVDQAREELAKGLDFRLEAKTCRKLVTPGCFAYGEVPPSALETIETLGPDLGPLVVIDVGYNDLARGYDASLDTVMRALVSAGVRRVVWVTLLETQDSWASINEQIRAAVTRWPQLTVADWAPAAATEPTWFADGPHMNEVGAAGFAAFLRPIVLQACGDACAPPPSVATMLAPIVRAHRAMLRWRGDVRARTYDVAVRRVGRDWRTVATRLAARSFRVVGAPNVLLEARVRARDADDAPGPWSPPRAFRL
jgi:hypothetical protein